MSDHDTVLYVHEKQYGPSSNHVCSNLSFSDDGFFIQVLVTCRLSYIRAANIRDDQGPRLDFSTSPQGGRFALHREQIEVKLAQVEVPVSQS